MTLVSVLSRHPAETGPPTGGFVPAVVLADVPPRRWLDEADVDPPKVASAAIGRADLSGVVADRLREATPVTSPARSGDARSRDQPPEDDLVQVTIATAGAPLSLSVQDSLANSWLSPFIKAPSPSPSVRLMDETGQVTGAPTVMSPEVRR